MRYGPLVERLAADGSEGWAVHFRAWERQAAGIDTLVLTVGDSDFESPPEAVAACKAALDAGKTRYTAILGDPRLRKAIAERHARQTGRATSPEQVVVAAGAQNALFSVVLSLLGPGDEAIVPEPMYLTYPGTVATPGGVMVAVPSPAERGFHVDPAEIEKAVTPNSRLILIASPNNPTGAVLGRAEWQAIGEIARAHDLWLVSDEVYADLVYLDDPVYPASLPELAERTIVVSSLSKSHAMTGWRAGWSVSPTPELPQHLFRLAIANTYGSPQFVQDAALAALEAAPGALPALREAYAKRRLAVAEAVDAIPGLSCLRPEGGMFVLVDVRRSGLSALDFANRLLDDTGLALLPADGFGASAAGHLRLNLGTPYTMLKDAMGRLAAFAAKL
ncbi:L-aspartate aminotransferase apoenzyme [Tistlia consotensis]|uniref:Aminotransferase n=1 Tax=Tistlia consotensis USBA 355 TaxID=560819 RepID=A0A1Y6B7W1_9PROT|nr:pyridoxal phosphate-dependent aminotransferase [Tistlia consotensis]SME88906.1 L-aspartate aminotransferase apoenzyme [Tistlia consotensis USBA 355]SNR25449.1 L-aspartate aminotransferase apoenzyme [Tistlia consotensis]